MTAVLESVGAADLAVEGHVGLALLRSDLRGGDGRPQPLRKQFALRLRDGAAINRQNQLTTHVAPRLRDRQSALQA